MRLLQPGNPLASRLSLGRDNGVAHGGFSKTGRPRACIQSDPARPGRFQSRCRCHLASGPIGGHSFRLETEPGAGPRGLVSFQQPDHVVMAGGISAPLPSQLLHIPDEGHLAQLHRATMRLGTGRLGDIPFPRSRSGPQPAQPAPGLSGRGVRVKGDYAAPNANRRRTSGEEATLPC